MDNFTIPSISFLEKIVPSDIPPNNDSTTVASAVYSTLLSTSDIISSRLPVLFSATTSFPSRLRHPSLAEPSPNWTNARNLYGWTWDVHTYALGSLFGVVAIYSFACIIQLFRLKHPRSVRSYFCLLHFLIFIFGATRAVFLLLDPYNHRDILPSFLVAVLLHLSFPCLTSSFCMVLAALVRTTKMKLMKSRIINVYLLIGILLGNFAFAIAAETVVDFFLASGKLTAFGVASQTYFIAWSLGLGVGYLVMFSKLSQAADNADGPGLRGTQKVSLAVRITFLTALLLLLFAGLHIYGLIGVYGFLREPDDTLDPWRWYGFHVGTRITELLLAALLAFVASLTIWSKAARKLPVVPAPRTTKTEVNREPLLMQDGMRLQSMKIPPPSPARTRRDFPVTFNPDGSKPEDFPRGFVIANRARSNMVRKVDSHLLETNPIHNDDEERYG